MIYIWNDGVFIRQEDIYMRLCILGATGAVGLSLVQLALQEGHEVTAYVRRRGNLPAHQNLNIVIAELDNHTALVQALKGQDAIISCLGAPLSFKNIVRPTFFMQWFMPQLISASHAAKQSRIIMLTAIGVGESLAKASSPARIGYRTVMASLFSDKTKAEQLLKSSNLVWTLVYAPVLGSKGEIAHELRLQKLQDISYISGLPKTSHANIAATLLKIAEQELWFRTSVVALS